MTDKLLESLVKADEEGRKSIFWDEQLFTNDFALLQELGCQVQQTAETKAKYPSAPNGLATFYQYVISWKELK